MRREAWGQEGSSAPTPEAEQQCALRLANEAIERRNMAAPVAGERSALRCECGDPVCRVCIDVSHGEYEAVRDYGSRFLITPNHENPENTSVLSENARFAVIDVVAGDARYQVLAGNPRHAWVDAADWRLE
ncbi:MAG: hypothetical protein QOJ89_5244 [bacterium]